MPSTPTSASVSATCCGVMPCLSCATIGATTRRCHSEARVGTAAAASRQLGRSDLAGKTGTTSNAIDGWFAGYSGPVVAVAWMGYDEPRSLGGREFGATLALPIWAPGRWPGRETR